MVDTEKTVRCGFGSFPSTQNIMAAAAQAYTACATLRHCGRSTARYRGGDSPL